MADVVSCELVKKVSKRGKEYTCNNLKIEVGKGEFKQCAELDCFDTELAFTTKPKKGDIVAITVGTGLDGFRRWYVKVMQEQVGSSFSKSS